MCPGRAFARREIKSFVASVLLHFELSLEDPDAPLPPFDATRVGLGILPPAAGADVRVRVRRR